MEDIGTEVSFKIRSAVKAKLMELGAFVDDELPDYIMVMVANKRSKQQMDADLQLFLGANTTNFTGWLHTVLQRLEEVTIANNLALSQKIGADVAKHVKTTEISSKSKVPVPTTNAEEESHKHKHEKKRKSSEDSSLSKKLVKESKSGSKSSSGKKSMKTKSVDVNTSISGVSTITSTLSHKVNNVSETDSVGKSVAEQTISDVSLVNSKESDNQQTPVLAKKTDSNIQTSVEKSSPKSSTLPHQSDEEDDDFINIKDDAEAMELLDTELANGSKLSRKSTQTASASEGKSVPAQASAEVMDEEVDELEQQRANLLRDLKRLDKPTKSSSQKSSLHDRLGPKVSASSVMDRLGARVDSRPRLNIIDPNELDIVRPTPREVEMTKQKVLDQLGKRPSEDRKRPAEDRRTSPQMKAKSRAMLSNSSTRESCKERQRVVSSNDRRTDDSGDRKQEARETIKVSVRDRLGVRMTVGTNSKRTVSVFESDKKHSEKVEVPVSKPTVMDRLGKRVDVGSPTERKASPQESETTKSRVADRLGKKITTDSPTEKKSQSPRGSEPTKLSVMDRLGKKLASNADDGRKDSSDVDDESSKKRQSRVLNIKEVHHSSTSKRQADDQSSEANEIPRKRSLLSSRVVAVKQGASTKLTDKEEEYDPSNPAVASVIRIKPRPKVPASMQACKNLLLKAMAEAQKSVSAAPKRKESQHLEGLFTRKYRDSDQPLEKINITVMNPAKHKEQTAGKDREEISDEEDEYKGCEDKSVKKEVIKTKTKQSLTVESLKRVRQKIVMKSSTNVKTPVEAEKIGVEEQMDKVSPAGSEPKAEEEEEEEEGNDDDIFEEVFDDDFIEEDLIEMTVSNGDSNLGNVSSINNDENIADTSDYVPTRIRHSSQPKEKAVRASSPQFVVTLDGLDPNLFGPRKRTVDTTQTKEEEEQSGITSPVPALDPVTDDRIHSWLLSLDKVKKKEEDRNEKNASTVTYKKPKLAVAPIVEPVKPLPVERCKFWPACSKGDLCEFLHPSTPCKMFPGCKFGERCLYIHPNCKFDISCTRRECPYSHHSGVHTGSSQVPVVGSGKSRPHSQPLCKFYPKCSNVNCLFLHPKPCRFGRACTNRDCTYFHEEIPTAEKLKWVNSNRF